MHAAIFTEIFTVDTAHMTFGDTLHLSRPECLQQCFPDLCFVAVDGGTVDVTVSAL